MPYFKIPPSEPAEGWIAALWNEQIGHDPALHDHSSHVGLIAGVVAGAMGLPEADVIRIQIAGQFHDIGKLNVPHAVLYAPRRLTAQEMTLVREHSVMGERRIRQISADTPLLGFVADVALHHHERYDGSGYPNGLVGDAVSLPSRIVAACDVYSALWERRPYKPALPHAEVMRRLLEGDDRMTPAMFDPAVIAAIRASQPELRRLLPE
ncbi:MAG: HD-GYP domain-containing protein [Tagaea sp.]